MVWPLSVSIKRVGPGGLVWVAWPFAVTSVSIKTVWVVWSLSVTSVSIKRVGLGGLVIVW